MTKEQRNEARLMVKRWLGRYVDLTAEKAQIKEQLARLEARRTAPGTARWGPEPRGSGSSDPMLDGLAAKDRLQSLYQGLLDRIDEEQLAIEQAIKGLGSRERRLIRYKYIDGLTWASVCEAMHYSWGQTHNIHAMALDRLVEIRNRGQ